MSSRRSPRRVKIGLGYEAATLIEAVKAGTDGDRFTEIHAVCTDIRTIRDRLGEIDQEAR